MGTRRPPLLPLAIIALAAASFGTLPFFARTLSADGMAAPAIALFRFALTALVTLPWLRFSRASAWGFLGGLLMGVGWIGFVQALEIMSVAEAGVLFMTYPFFAIAFSVVFFADRLSAKGVLAAALIVFAAALVAPWPAQGAAPLTAVAMAFVFALAAPAAYGLLINILVHKVSGVPALSAVSSIALGATLGVLPLAFATDAGSLLPTSSYGLVVLAVFSAATAMVPQVAMTMAAPRVGATATALAGAAELPTMFMVGWLAFGEPITVLHAAAAALIITAIALAPGAPAPPPAYGAHGKP